MARRAATRGGGAVLAAGLAALLAAAGALRGRPAAAPRGAGRPARGRPPVARRAEGKAPRQPGGVLRVPKRLRAERLGADDDDVDWDAEYVVTEARMQEPASQANLVVNSDIRAREVRIVGVWNDTSRGLDEMDDVVETRDALDRARELGLDLVCDGVDRDPPHAHIVTVAKYPFLKARLQRREPARPHKVKEVRLAYNVGDGDVRTKAKLIQAWVRDGWQVECKVLMPGTTVKGGRSTGTVKHPLESRGAGGGADALAERLLGRIREAVAQFAKVPSAVRGGPAAIKDVRGDLVMTLAAGPDPSVLKSLRREGRGPAAALTPGGGTSLQEWVTAMSDGRIRQRRKLPPGMGDVRGRFSQLGGSSRKEERAFQRSAESTSVEQLLNDLANTKKWLLKCGIERHELDKQEEVAELHARLAAARARAEASA